MFSDTNQPVVGGTSLSQQLKAWSKDLQKPYCNGEALWWERLALSGETLSNDPERERLICQGEAAFRASAKQAEMTALCLSGGGIRSAAFSLGVVQALASKSLLTSFSYLSTVSGGGYLGGFLQRWILGRPEDGRSEEGVQKALAASLRGTPSPQIAGLREGTNFVTPRVASARSAIPWPSSRTPGACRGGAAKPRVRLDLGL